MKSTSDPHPEEKDKHRGPDDQPGDRDRWKNQDLQQTLRFKIIPEKSQFIIGSQSIYTHENYL